MTENFYGDPNQVYNTGGHDYRADGSTIENNHAGDDHGGVGNRVHRYSHQLHQAMSTLAVPLDHHLPSFTQLN
jgi:hypothetical protein